MNAEEHNNNWCVNIPNIVYIVDKYSRTCDMRGYNLFTEGDQTKYWKFYVQSEEKQ